MKSNMCVLRRLCQISATSSALPAPSLVAPARRRSSGLACAAAAQNRSPQPSVPFPIAPHATQNRVSPTKSLLPSHTPRTTVASTLHHHQQHRSHYSYADGPGRFAFSEAATAERHAKRLQTWDERGFTVGIGGPVGSGKTALVLALIKRLAGKKSDPGIPPLGVVTNDIFTQEDAQFLWKKQDVLSSAFIKAVETGGCPHAAIREDVSANLTACEDLTHDLKEDGAAGGALPPLILCESGGDNLAANFSRELADLTLYVIDVAGGDKVPRKGGPGITQSDLLVINKIDLAEAVGADLGVMRRDADKMRSVSGHVQDDNEHHHHHDHDHSHDSGEEPGSGPTVFASVKNGTSLDDIEDFILEQYRTAMAPAN